MSEPVSIASAFADAVAPWSDRPFLHAPSEALGGAAAYALTYGEAASAIDALAAKYQAAGIGFGHRVAVALDNHPVFFLHLIALNRLGASVVPLNANAAIGEIALVLRAAVPVLAVAWPSHFALIEAARTEVGGQLEIVAPGTSIAPVREPREPRASGLDDEAAMLFTSGTTGLPKGCILSNDYFVAVGALYAGLGGLCALEPGAERILTPLPVTHMNALAVSFMAAMMTGACLIQLDRFHASTWWRTVGESRASVIHYLGVMPAILLQLPERDSDRTGHSIRFGFGAGVDPLHQARFEARFGFPLIEAWAMTETGAGAWITANEEPRHVGARCFGRVPDGLDIRIVDDAGKPVTLGIAGELLVRRIGPEPRRHFFGGYHQDPGATAEAWAGGWFHTGDVVRQGPDGSLFFVDRNKNIVRRSGENIAAVEVEGVLMRHPAVQAAAILPVPDEIRGEEVMALVVPRNPDAPRDAVLAEALVRHGLAELVYFKTPGYVAFVDALPTTASQKVQRGITRAMGRDLVDKGLAFDLRHLKRKGAA